MNLADRVRNLNEKLNEAEPSLLDLLQDLDKPSTYVPPKEVKDFVKLVSKTHSFFAPIYRDLQKLEQQRQRKRMYSRNVVLDDKLGKKISTGTKKMVKDIGSFLRKNGNDDLRFILQKMDNDILTRGWGDQEGNFNWTLDVLNPMEKFMPRLEELANKKAKDLYLQDNGYIY
jgi:hypothetical protein